MRFRRRRTDPSERSHDPDVPSDGEVGASVDVGSATGVGGRPDNQDRCFVDTGLAVVSDGMGGYRGGAVAAELAVAAVRAELDDGADDRPEAERLVAAFLDRANAAVRDARDADVELGQMGATLTVATPIAASTDESRWLVADVGDSPTFLLHDGGTTRVTVDHNRAAELVAAGVLTEDRAATHPGRHLLVRAIGPDPAVEVDVADVVLRVGDALVLASDGLNGPIGATDIATIVGAAGSAVIVASDLVAAAESRGATDNVTVVVVRQVPSSIG